MTDDTTKSAELELEKSRESAARLLETLAEKIGTARRTASGTMQRAAEYVQAHSVRDMAADVESAVRWRPVVSIAAAVVAGFLVGRVIRRRD